jgi:predicted nucleotide-binding protein
MACRLTNTLAPMYPFEYEADKVVRGHDMVSEMERWIGELQGLLPDLERYLQLDAKLVQKEYPNIRDFREELSEIEELRATLQARYGQAENVIAAILEKDRDDLPFRTALSSGIKYEARFSSSKQAVDLLQIAISEVSDLYNDHISRVRKRERGLKTPPKVFISHGPESKALDRLCSFLSELGVEPLVVGKGRSKGMTSDERVQQCLDQADGAIILATADRRVGGKAQPGKNVIHEMGLAKMAFPVKIVYLLEERAEFPSNVRPKEWCYFTQGDMEKALMTVVRKLRAFAGV